MEKMVEKMGTGPIFSGYFFYVNCPQVDTVLFLPKKRSLHPFFYVSRKRENGACPHFIKR